MARTTSEDCVRVLHVLSGDLWAGAEVATTCLLDSLARREDVSIRAVVLNEGAAAQRLRESGIATTVLPEGSLSVPRLAVQLAKIAYAWRPDIVHTHRYKENVLGAIAATWSGAAHIRTAHGRQPDVGDRGGLAGVGGLLDAALADWIGSTWISVSGELAGHIRGLRRTVYTVSNGLPEVGPASKRDALVAALRASEPCWLVGFVGRLENVKRPDRFLRLARRLPARVAGRIVLLVVAGDGSNRDAVEAMIRDSDVADRILWLTAAPDGDRIVASLDVLVVTSDHEGLPMVILEAMRAGVAVVAPDVGGIREALGASPFVVRSDDEARLDPAVLLLLENDGVRRAWCTELTTRFRSRFTITRVADEIVNVYRRVLGGER